MSSSFSKFTLLTAVTVLAAALWRPAGAAAPISFCIDGSNPSARSDRKTAEAAARAVGAEARIVTFNGRSGGDDGFDLKRFHTLAEKRCNLIMGFPMEPGSRAVPAGMRHTRPYRDTGFVLVSSKGVRLDALSPSSRVAVAFNTPANLFLVGRKGLKAIVYDNEAKSLDALAAGKVQAAASWGPSVVQYQREHPQAKSWKVRNIRQPHARWQLTALYAPRSTDAARRFERGLKALNVDDSRQSDHGASNAKGSDGYPRLYTEEQAVRGAHVYAEHCAKCHGAKLQGIVGPALKGDGFASKNDNFNIGGMFGFFSQQMPAGQPGSLKKIEYADLMAFLLRENGYQAGNSELTYDQAAASKVPLVAHGGRNGARNLASQSSETAKRAGD